MSKSENYRYLQSLGGRVAWIANVFFTRAGAGANLKALVRLLQAGYEVSDLPFTLPTEGLLLDGKYASVEDMRAAAGAA